MATGMVPGDTFLRSASVHAAARYRFDLIPGLSNDPFYLTLRDGADAEARKLGVTVSYLGSPYAFSAAAQIPYVKFAIAQHPDAILIAPASSTALVGPLRRAVSAGIPVITVDTSLSTSLAVASVSSPNEAGGRLAASTLASAVGGQGVVAEVSVQPGVSTTDERESGFARALHAYPAIRFLGVRYDHDVPATATAEVRRLIKRHANITGVFTTNTVSGLGAIAALHSSPAASVDLVEFDAAPAQVQALRDGLVTSLVAQDPWKMGVDAVRLADRWVSGRRQGLATHDHTPLAVITRRNVNNPSLRHFLYRSG